MRFFADVFQLYPQSSRQYRCTDISDFLYCQLGVLRCLSSATTGHFFRMNMRTHHLSCLGMANPEDGKKKAHDLHPLGAGLDLQTGSLARITRPSEGSLGRAVMRVFHTDQ